MCMDELASTEFRKRYAALKEPVIVTVNGHPIGTWTPLSPTLVGTHQLTRSMAKFGRTSQQARDELLHSINTSGRKSR
jgi:hypothetical protein